MAEAAIVDVVRRYLAVLPARGIHARRAILFGSQANGTADEWSDIDLIVVAPEFDVAHTHAMVRELWRARLDADVLVEPIPCGESEWETDDGRPILEIARREGIEIVL